MRKNLSRCALPAFLLVLVMFTAILWTVIPMQTDAVEYNEGNFTYTVSNGEATVIGVYNVVDGKVSIPSTLGGYPVTAIGDWTFYYVSGLTDVTIPDSVTTIGDYAFYRCAKLTGVTIPDGVIAIGDYAFSDCTGLTSVMIPGCVTTIGASAFEDCTSLSSVTIGGAVSVIGEDAFNRCSSLSGIWVDAENRIYSSDINGVLFNKNKTTLISFPRGFSGTYIIPSGVTTVDTNAFSYCTGLTGVLLPDSVTALGDYAFSGCTGLTDVTIGDGVTTVGDFAFSWCENLICVTIPDNVTTVGDGAFYHCSSLTDVYYSGTVEQWNAISVGNANAALTNATRHLVTPVTLTGIAVKVLPDKNAYLVGETIDTAGLILTAAYSDGSTKEITEGFSVTGFDAEMIGTQTLTVSYKGFTTTLTVTVECPHTGDTYLVGQQDATCEDEGYTGDTRCADCGALLHVGELLPILPLPEFGIVSQPAALEITAGFDAKFSVAATDVASYKWQYRRNENAPWVNTTLPGYATDTLSVPAILTRNDYQYRCRITGNNGKLLYTEPATLTVLDSVAITTQPTRQIVNVNTNAIFTVEAEGAGLTYQWLYRKNDEDFWKQTGMEGSKTNTLTVPALLARNGYQYVCTITDENGIKINSKVAVLSAIGFTSQPKDRFASVNANAKFSVTAEGQNLTYRWQYRKTEDGNWMNTAFTGFDTDTLTVPATASRNGYQYRCKITDELGIVCYSNEATLTVG